MKIVNDNNEKYKGIINIFGQYAIGTYTQQTSYVALNSAFKNLRTYLSQGTTIAIPYKMGCGLAGGDWDIVAKIIEDQLADYFDITIYKKENYDEKKKEN